MSIRNGCLVAFFLHFCFRLTIEFVSLSFCLSCSSCYPSSSEWPLLCWIRFRFQFDSIGSLAMGGRSSCIAGATMLKLLISPAFSKYFLVLVMNIWIHVYSCRGVLQCGNIFDHRMHKCVDARLAGILYFWNQHLKINNCVNYEN